jgi:tripartite-type tricarboxylate transporter receptor subunit TctC
VTKLNRALAEVMLTQEAQTFFIGLGMQPKTSTPQEAADYIRAEAPRWTKIIKGIGISVD